MTERCGRENEPDDSKDSSPEEVVSDLQVRDGG